MASKTEAPANYVIASLYRGVREEHYAGAIIVDRTHLEDVTQHPDLPALIRADEMGRDDTFWYNMNTGSISHSFRIADANIVKRIIEDNEGLVNTTLILDGLPVHVSLIINAVVLESANASSDA